MKRLALIVGLATAILSTGAFAGTYTSFDSRTGTNSMVTDPVVPPGSHWEGGTAIGRDWSTDQPYGKTSAEMLRINLHDCCNGRRINDRDEYGNMAQ